MNVTSLTYFIDDGVTHLIIWTLAGWGSGEEARVGDPLLCVMRWWGRRVRPGCSPPVKYFMVEKILSENSGLPAPKRHGVDQRTGAGGGREGWGRGRGGSGCEQLEIWDSFNKPSFYIPFTEIPFVLQIHKFILAVDYFVVLTNSERHNLLDKHLLLLSYTEGCLLICYPFESIWFWLILVSLVVSLFLWLWCIKYYQTGISTN